MKILIKTTNRKATETIKNSSFYLRVLSQENFQLLNGLDNLPDMIYAFDHVIPAELNNIPFIQIDGLNTSKIYKLFQ